MVYKPVLEDRWKYVGDATMTMNGGGKGDTSTSDGGALDDDSNSAGPPLTRPSAKVFQSIFDAKPGMDISSSDDDNDVDVPKTDGQDKRTVAQTKEEGGEGVTPERKQDIGNGSHPTLRKYDDAVAWQRSAASAC